MQHTSTYRDIPIRKELLQVPLKSSSKHKSQPETHVSATDVSRFGRALCTKSIANKNVLLDVTKHVKRDLIFSWQ
jgi:hypothetical protein